MTIQGLKALLVELLDSSDTPLSAGQVTEKLGYGGVMMAKSTLRTRLQAMVKAGDLLSEQRTFRRNGRRVRGSVFGTPHTFRVEFDALKPEDDPLTRWHNSLD